MEDRKLKGMALLGVVVFFSATLFSQDFYPGKDLAFGEYAAGGSYNYVTIINLTNRGTATYNGTLNFVPDPNTRTVNLLMNGTPTSSSQQITLYAGATQSLTITSGDPSLPTQTGFLFIDSSDRTQNSLLEGAITYNVTGPDGTTVLDSTGITPSAEIFQTTIPFDDFSAVGLALANSNAGRQTANVKLTIFDANGIQVAYTTQVLTWNQHLSEFLSEIFAGVRLPGDNTHFKGRIDIQSDNLIFGTAVTFKGGQGSSLPFLPSLKIYNYAITMVGHSLTGKLYLSVNGPHIIAYDHVETSNGSPTNSGLDPASGFFVNGNLQLLFESQESTPLIWSATFPGYNPTLTTLSASILGYYVNFPSFAGQGTITLTALN